ncbi:MAG: histidine phosphatase family protein [Minisyncoccia bacterium]
MNFALALLIFLVGMLLIGVAVAELLKTNRIKRFYFIRHGETLMNAEHRKQGAEGGLTTKGKEEAARTGSALIPCGITRILSSTYERAQETARIIAEQTHAPVSFSDLLIERRNASEVIGKPTDDEQVKHIMNLTAYGYHDDEYRYSDEENFIDLKKRVVQCLAFLETQKETELAVITHHAFLQMLLSYLLVGKALHAGDYVKLSFFNPTDNGSITVCEYTPFKRFSKEGAWKILSYNAKANETHIA